jgi:hypothetical protein
MTERPEQNPSIRLHRDEPATHHAPDVEPLPAEFPAELRRIDRALHADAGRFVVPDGLEERVFDASVELLPNRGRAGRGGARRLRVVGVRRPGGPARSWGRSQWGRMALAASLGLAFLVAAFVMQRGASRPMPVASGSIVDVGGRWLEEDPRDAMRDQMDREVAYLLDTRDISSHEVTSDLEAIVADLEM